MKNVISRPIGILDGIYHENAFRTVHVDGHKFVFIMGTCVIEVIRDYGKYVLCVTLSDEAVNDYAKAVEETRPFVEALKNGDVTAWREVSRAIDKDDYAHRDRFGEVGFWSKVKRFIKL